MVRPDGHVGDVVRFVKGLGTAEALGEYFAGLAGRV